MSAWSCRVGARHYGFDSLRELMAKATPSRSGDELAGIAAGSAEERVAAQLCLAEVPLRRFLEEPLIPYEDDDVTRLILDSHVRAAFAPVASLTVGEFRDWLLRYETDEAALEALAPGLTPEMAAAASKLMGNQDLILAAQKRRVVTAFRGTLGLPGRLSVQLQPNHPTDDPQGIAAAILDGLLYGCGDAVIGINPVTDSVGALDGLLRLLDDLSLMMWSSRFGFTLFAADIAGPLKNPMPLVMAAIPVSDASAPTLNGVEYQVSRPSSSPIESGGPSFAFTWALVMPHLIFPTELRS